MLIRNGEKTDQNENLWNRPKSRSKNFSKMQEKYALEMHFLRDFPSSSGHLVVDDACCYE